MGTPVEMTYKDLSSSLASSSMADRENQRKSKMERHDIDLNKTKVRVDKVHIEGVARTQDDVVMKMVKEVFAATTFTDMAVKAQNVRKKLEGLDAFNNINIYIDTSRGPNSTQNGYDVTFYVSECGRIKGGVHTLVGNNNDGSVVVQGKFPNIIGRGESVTLEYQHGVKKTTAFNAHVMKPLAPWLSSNPKVTTSIFQMAADWPWSGFREIGRGLMFDFSFLSSPFINHSLKWEGLWRDIACINNTTAFAVREEAGHTVKSSIKHCLAYDRRDHTVIPTKGALFKLQQEFAGIGGNVGFHKHEIEAQYNFPMMFIKDLIFQATLKAGVMKPSLQRTSVTCINDRFFLGGPLSLRGFKIYGVGPHSEGYSLGANTYWAGAVHIYTPLPFLPTGRGGLGDFVRTHFFFNAGNIGNNDFKSLNMLIDRLRYSIGGGLVFNIGHVGRLELHYAVPLSQQSGDRTEKGLQFGIGISFI